jgi:uncharacterized membrane protein YdfJ with MMPL/SSD domain
VVVDRAVGGNVIILASMLGLAVGIGYTLFILCRFRTELREGLRLPWPLWIAVAGRALREAPFSQSGGLFGCAPNDVGRSS